jgi:hypothetical protein
LCLIFYESITYYKVEVWLKKHLQYSCSYCKHSYPYPSNTWNVAWKYFIRPWSHSCQFQINLCWCGAWCQQILLFLSMVLMTNKNSHDFFSTLVLPRVIVVIDPCFWHVLAFIGVTISKIHKCKMLKRIIWSKYFDNSSKMIALFVVAPWLMP